MSCLKYGLIGIGLSVSGVALASNHSVEEHDMQHFQQANLKASSQAYAKHVGLPSRIQSQGERVFIFSPKYKQWAAYDASGKRVAYGRANGGADWCKDVGRPCRTPVGDFRIVSKRGADCRSSKYPKGRGGAPMPYCMFFHKAGYAIHGSPKIGERNSSHGCVRVTTKSARWLHKNFLTPGAKVQIWSY